MAVNANAQIEREDPPAPENTRIVIRTHRVVGKVVDRNSKPLEAASVQLFGYFNGSKSDSLVSGMLTRNNGDFVFENFPKADSFRIRISGIGFSNWEKIISSPIAQNAVTDLGNIMLVAEPQVMANVVVTAQRPALQMGIDRKNIFC